MNDTVVIPDVDTRILKSGQIRPRFKLNESSMALVKHALELTGYKYPNSALDAVCLSYVAWYPFRIEKLVSPATGKERFIVRLYPEQYQVVRMALDLARQHVTCDADALALICSCFIASETANTPQINTDSSKTNSKGFLRPMGPRV